MRSRDQTVSRLLYLALRHPSLDEVWGVHGHLGLLVGGGL